MVLLLEAICDEDRLLLLERRFGATQAEQSQKQQLKASQAVIEPGGSLMVVKMCSPFVSRGHQSVLPTMPSKDLRGQGSCLMVMAFSAGKIVVLSCICFRVLCDQSKSSSEEAYYTMCPD